MDIDENTTATSLRDEAYALTLESAWAQRLAFYRSGEWRQLGHRTFAEWDSAHADRLQVRGASIDWRREQVRELSAEGVPVAEQAALLNVHEATVKKDRAEMKVARKKGRQQAKPGASQLEVAEPDPDAAAPFADVPDGAIDEWVESAQSVQDASYLHEFVKELGRLARLLTFDGERLGPLLSPVELDLMEAFERSYGEMFAAARRARSGLRIVGKRGTP